VIALGFPLLANGNRMRASANAGRERDMGYYRRYLITVIGLLLGCSWVVGCQSLTRGAARPGQDYENSTAILNQFFRDNAPEDVWVSVRMPDGNLNLWVPEEMQKALVKNLQEDTESVPSGLPKGWGLVGPPPPVLILCFHGPQYTVELYLEGDGRPPCIGTFQHYTVRNAPLAKTLANLMEDEENRESLGPYASLLRRWLEGMAEGRFEMPEPTEAELKAMAKEEPRLSYSYEMSREEMAFLEETEAFLKAGRDINAPDEEEGLTRLHHAAWSGWRTALQYILLHGGDPNAHRSRGRG